MTVRAARLTPPGTAAIATIAVVGEEAWPLLLDLFRDAKGQSLSETPAVGTLHFGHFGPPPGDEVVLAHRPGTTEPWFEIHCHGGPILVDWILEQLSSRGVTIVDWTELEGIRLNSWLRAAAAVALTRAMTVQTAAILLAQYHGALENDIRSIIDDLSIGEVEKTATGLQRLLATKVAGLHLAKPLRVGIFGSPNAGKSSLINRLAGFERAVVSPIPGTTREMTTTVVAFDGWPIELIDSPGVRETTDELEHEGVRRTLAAATARRCDVVVWVMDRSVPFVAPPEDVAIDLTLVNKVDLPPAWDESRVNGPSIAISATTGAGLQDFQSWLINLFVKSLAPQGGVVFSSAVASLVEAAAADISAGKFDSAQTALAALLQPEQPSFPASNIESALD
ncbi:MAG: GTPase [Gemmataceae bacterium]